METGQHSGRAGSDPIRRWLEAAEELGEHTGIRFGRLAPGATEPEWFLVPHLETDGIGGFARLLHARGAPRLDLPRGRHLGRASLGGWLRMWLRRVAPARGVRWRPVPGVARPAAPGEPPPAVAWHTFDRPTTRRIRQACRAAGCTMNSFLLLHLSRAVQPFVAQPAEELCWLVPVNMRGAKGTDGEAGNQFGFLNVVVRAGGGEAEVHGRIGAALRRGEHAAAWEARGVGRWLPRRVRRSLVRSGRVTGPANAGAFSNLGAWDPEETIAAPGCLGHWLFLPAVLRSQRLGAGALTFQNQLGLALHAHPELTTSPDLPAAVLRAWSAGITAAAG